jgi:peptidoglycan-N-acetylglucosamine deacetylase
VNRARRIAARLRRAAAIVESCPHVPEQLLSLTFDDGPSEWTGPILDLLRAHRAKATFFVLGVSVHGHEDVLRRVVDEGHEVANHTQMHLDPARVGDDVLVRELRSAEETIAAVCGVAPRLVRPPYGGDPKRMARAARTIGAGPVILWSVDPADWRQPDARAIVDHVLRAARRGAIVDLHDGIPPNSSGEPSRAATVEAVRALLPVLRERGYRLVTVSELLAARL